MTSPRGKVTTLVCHLTKKVNKAGQLTYFSTNIEGEAYRATRQIITSL
jgi:hypothetical protein